MHNFNLKKLLFFQKAPKWAKSNVFCFSGQANPVSWTHFFMSMSQYYTNLRQERAPQSDMTHVYRAPHHHQLRGITPQELHGLVSVLQLTQRVASQVLR